VLFAQSAGDVWVAGMKYLKIFLHDVTTKKGMPDGIPF